MDHFSLLTDIFQVRKVVTQVSRAGSNVKAKYRGACTQDLLLLQVNIHFIFKIWENTTWTMCTELFEAHFEIIQQVLQIIREKWWIGGSDLERNQFVKKGSVLGFVFTCPSIPIRAFIIKIIFKCLVVDIFFAFSANLILHCCNWMIQIMHLVLEQKWQNLPKDDNKWS